MSGSDYGSDGFTQAIEEAVARHKADTANLGEELRQWALWYTQVMGWPVFPLIASRKVPATEHSFYEATTFEKQVRKWWNGRTLYNIGVPTGAPGPDVLDVEGRLKPGGSGWAAYYLLKDAGMLAGAFRLVGTPSEGAHLYFQGSAQKSGALKRLHVEVKATGGYITVPPSHITHPYYGRYRLIDDLPPTARRSTGKPRRPCSARRSRSRHAGSPAAAQAAPGGS